MRHLARRSLLWAFASPFARSAEPGYFGQWPAGNPVALYSGKAQQTFLLFEAANSLWVGYYDHRSGMLAKPVRLVDARGDSRLGMDAAGRLTVTTATALFRATEPFSIQGFSLQSRIGKDVKAQGPPGVEAMGIASTAKGESVWLCGRGRELLLARQAGEEWAFQKAFERSKESGAGKLYIEGNTWRVLVPGQALELWESRDQGKQWRKLRELGPAGAGNVIQPLSFHADLIALWTVRERLYFTNRDAIRVYRLPDRMSGAFSRPERLPLANP